MSKVFYSCILYQHINTFIEKVHFSQMLFVVRIKLHRLKPKGKIITNKENPITIAKILNNKSFYLLYAVL